MKFAGGLINYVTLVISIGKCIAEGPCMTLSCGISIEMLVLVLYICCYLIMIGCGLKFVDDGGSIV